MAKLTLKQAVKEHCKDCIYDPTGLNAGTWLMQVEACTATDCKLYEHRPVTGAEKERRRQEHFNSLSPEEQQAALLDREKKAEAFKRRVHGATTEESFL